MKGGAQTAARGLSARLHSLARLGCSAPPSSAPAAGEAAPKTHPADQRSIAGPYRRLPQSSSGGRYQRVTAYDVKRPRSSSSDAPPTEVGAEAGSVDEARVDSSSGGVATADTRRGRVGRDS